METILPYVYLLRVPLLVWLAAVLLAPLSVPESGALHSMFGGMFDLNGRGALLVAFLGSLLCAAIAVCALIVLDSGWVRTAIVPPRGWFTARVAAQRLHRINLGRGAIAVIAISALPMATLGRALHCLGRLLPGCLGALLGVALCFAVFWIWYSSFGPPKGGWLWRKIDRILERAHDWMAGLLRFSPSGYLESNGRELRPGHGFAALWSSVYAMLYAALGVVTGLGLNNPAWIAWLQPPSLAYLLILLTLLCLVLSALTYFFDRFRVPVLAVLAIAATVTADSQESDHQFEVASQAPSNALKPENVLGTTPTPIIVCTSGGGILAQAWTGYVLTQLEELSGAKFSPNVRLISSVSGGSVGAMHFVAAYGKSGAIPPAKRPEVIENSMRSSLDAVAWGFAYPDLLRLAVPLVPPWLDRGWALERAWDPAGELSKGLGTWRDLRQPALILNATITETGARIVFPTFDFSGKGNLWDTKAPLTFYDEGVFCGKHDVPIRTAVRLSASFPYVAPAARPAADLPQSKRYHLVDGGYYDNYGVASAINFLDRAFKPNETGKRVLMIQLRSSKSEPRKAAQKGQGPLFQLSAPVRTLLNMRTTAQLERNDIDTNMLEAALKIHGVDLVHAEFESPGDGPLSWHLTAAEKAAVKDAWKLAFLDCTERKSQLDKVMRYLEVPNWEPCRDK